MSWRNIVDKHAFLIIVTLVVMGLVVLFHKVMAPFLIALIFVYLMEPIVRWMSKKRFRKRLIPRWFAVISVYIVIFSASLGFGFLFIPSLASEIGQATEALPKFFTQVKEESIPSLSAKIDKFMFNLRSHSQHELQAALVASQQKLHLSFSKALEMEAQNTIPSIDLSGAEPILRLNQDREPKHSEIATDSSQQQSLLRLKRTADNEYLILAGDQDLLFESDGKGSFLLKLKQDPKSDIKPNEFSLEEEIGRIVNEFIESSTKYAGNALSILQYLLEFIVNTFIQLILVFMLAAFISIDLPSIMGHLRRAFMDELGNANTYDELLAKFNRGLSGVIRGQLLICLINGVLTGVGLTIFGVDFALLLGIIAGVLSIIPVFGTIISTIPAVLLALMQGFTTAVAVLVWILIIHFIDANILTPKIVGSSSHLHPVVIIFAILAGQTFGVLGVILAVPTTSIFQTILLFIRDRIRVNNSQKTLSGIGGNEKTTMNIETTQEP